MAKKSSKKENNPLNLSKEALTAGEKSWKKFQEMPYDNSRVGQAFILSSPKIPKDKPPKKSGKD
jgi:hypothetical protein